MIKFLKLLFVSKKLKMEPKCKNAWGKKRLYHKKIAFALKFEIQDNSVKGHLNKLTIRPSTTALIKLEFVVPRFLLFFNKSPKVNEVRIG